MNPLRMKAKTRLAELKKEEKNIAAQVSRIFYEMQNYVDPFFKDVSTIKSDLLLLAAQELDKYVKTSKENKAAIIELEEELED